MAATTEGRGLELPQAFIQTDATAQAAQRRHLSAVRLELGLLIAAALVGVFMFPVANGVDLAGLAGSMLFLGALALRQHVAAQRPDDRWYRTRAVAESIKTLVWRYAVGGEPFGRDLTRTEVDHAYIDRVREVMADLKGVVLEVVDAVHLGQITPSMLELRESTLAERRAAYMRDRVEDQRRWYTERAGHNASRHRQWSIVTLLLELLGVLAGLIKALGLDATTGSLLGISAAVVAAITAWNQTKQHGTLASSYAVAAQELATIASLAVHQRTEGDWARFVDSSEAAISREHTLWRASRSR